MVKHDVEGRACIWKIEKKKQKKIKRKKKGDRKKIRADRYNSEIRSRFSLISGRIEQWKSRTIIHRSIYKRSERNERVRDGILLIQQWELDRFDTNTHTYSLMSDEVNRQWKDVIDCQRNSSSSRLTILQRYWPTVFQIFLSKIIFPINLL